MTDLNVMTKDELLAAIEVGWDRLNAFLGTLDAAQLTRFTDAAGWTVKDHVIHLAIWEDGMYALLERLMRVQYMGIDAKTWESGDYDAINAIIQQRYKNLSWADVQQKRQQIHQRLIEKIGSLADADLMRPYRFYEPASTEDRPVIRWLVSNTSAHYAEHIPWMDAIAKGGKTKPMTHAELMTAIQQGWDDLNAYLDTLNQEQLTQPTDAAGWTAKDHVIHMAVWEGDLIVLFDGGDRREALAITDHDAWNHSDWDKLNAVFQQRYQDLTWAEVQQWRQQIHQRVIEKLGTLSDEDIHRPYRYYQPRSTVENSVMGWITGATYQHYAEHTPWIDAIVKREG